MTKRLTIQGIESWLGDSVQVLDHGFIRVIDYMGGDEAIVQAARVSYGAGTKQVSEDTGLIRYLMRRRHTSPFEMCEIKLHIKMPIFVARQWIRHRMANVNEYSARYSVMAREFFLPHPTEISGQSVTNKQGRGGELDVPERVAACEEMTGIAEDAWEAYERLLDSGVARELSRTVLPLSTYTEMYWKIDLHNLLHFLALRADSHAQREIQAYADVMLQIVKAWCPITYKAFLDYRKHSITLSAEAAEVVQRWIRGEKVTREDTTLSKREWDELMDNFSHAG